MNGIKMAGMIPDGVGQSDVSPLKKAIKDYQDKMLTGLTEDERKEIEAKVTEYRKKCIEAGMDAKEIQKAVDSYYKKLLKEYGAKFNVDFDRAPGDKGTASASGTETGGTAKLPEVNTADSSKTNTEVRTEPDGTMYLLITTVNGLSMKIKIGNAGDSEDDLAAGLQNAKNNIGVMDYEKNIDAFFEEESKISVAS